MLNKIRNKIFDNYVTITVLVAILVVIVPIQHYFFTSYNNYTIFQHSSFHFFQKANLYLEYPKEYYDLFLYNPSFALLMAPIAYLPTLLGMIIWVALIAGGFCYAVSLLPFGRKSNLFILYFTFLELTTSVQNFQTNSLIAASILLAFIFLERASTFKSSLFVNLGFFIKGYGAIAGAFYLLKSPRIKGLFHLLAWFLVLLCLPLLFYTPDQFIDLYRQWFLTISNDHDINVGISVMGFITSVFNYKSSVYYIQFLGIFMLLCTMIYITVKRSYEEVKYLFLAYIMIWIVIFNQAAESSTYIIASTGVSIWYVNSKKSVTDKVLIILTFILTVISPSDLFPSYLRKHFVEPYNLKVLGPMLIFIKIQACLIYTYVKSGNNSSALQSS